MRALRKAGRRLNLTITIAAAAVGLAATALPAAAADIVVTPNATPLPQLAQDYDAGDGYDAYYGSYRPVCPYRYYYTCRRDPDGIPHCACWPGIGFYLFGIY